MKLTGKAKEEFRKIVLAAGVTEDDVFTHKHYKIIKRASIEKIQYNQGITVHFEVVKAEKDYVIIQAFGKLGAETIETFGSAIYGEAINRNDKWIQTGTTQSWYLAEIAEKRALSRVVLKLVKLYQYGIFGEDEDIINNGLDR